MRLALVLVAATASSLWLVDANQPHHRTGLFAARRLSKSSPAPTPSTGAIPFPVLTEEGESAEVAVANVTDAAVVVAAANFDDDVDVNSFDQFDNSPNYRPPPPPVRRDANGEMQQRAPHCHYDPERWSHHAGSAIRLAVMFERRTGLTCSDCLRRCEEMRTAPWTCRSVTYDAGWRICDLFAIHARDAPYNLVDQAGRDYFEFRDALPPSDVELSVVAEWEQASQLQRHEVADPTNDLAPKPDCQPPPPPPSPSPSRPPASGLRTLQEAVADKYSADSLRKLFTVVLLPILCNNNNKVQDDRAAIHALGESMERQLEKSDVDFMSSKTVLHNIAEKAALAAGRQPLTTDEVARGREAAARFNAQKGHDRSSTSTTSTTASTTTPSTTTSSAAPSPSPPLPSPFPFVEALLRRRSSSPSSSAAASSSASSSEKSAPPPEPLMARHFPRPDDRLEVDFPEPDAPMGRGFPKPIGTDFPSPDSFEQTNGSEEEQLGRNSAEDSDRIELPRRPVQRSPRARAAKTNPIPKVMEPEHLERHSHITAAAAASSSSSSFCEPDERVLYMQWGRTERRETLGASKFVDHPVRSAVHCAALACENGRQSRPSKDSGDDDDSDAEEARRRSVSAFTCASLVWSPSAGCELSETAASHARANELVPSLTNAYLERMCAPKLVAPPPSAEWGVALIDAVANHILVGHVQEVEDVFSLRECLVACLGAKKMYGFVCRSAMYYPNDADQNCLMNSESRHTAPRVFVPEDRDVQMVYFELPIETAEQQQEESQDFFARDDGRPSESAIVSSRWTLWSSCDRKAESALRFRYEKCKVRDVRKCSKESAFCRDVQKGHAIKVERIHKDECAPLLTSDGKPRCDVAGSRTMADGSLEACRPSVCDPPTGDNSTSTLPPTTTNITAAH